MHVNIAPSNIPLLLTKGSLKQENMKVNFENNTIAALQQPINLIVTKSGHYTIPITNNKCTQNDLTSLTSRSLTLANNKSDRDLAMKPY